MPNTFRRSPAARCYIGNGYERLTCRSVDSGKELIRCGIVSTAFRHVSLPCRPRDSRRSHSRPRVSRRCLRRFARARELTAKQRAHSPTNLERLLSMRRTRSSILPVSVRCCQPRQWQCCCGNAASETSMSRSACSCLSSFMRKPANSPKRTITPRMLLAHSSGLPAYERLYERCHTASAAC